MKVSFENSQEKINEASITEFEKRFGIKLPETYKSFLLEHNGGKPTPRKFITVDKKNISRVKLFFPLGENYPNNLSENYITFVKGNKIPSSLVPIGEDPIDNLICISIEGKDFGSVFYWNQDEEDDDYKPSFKRVKIVTDDFLKFLNSLSE